MRKLLALLVLSVALPAYALPKPYIPFKTMLYQASVVGGSGSAGVGGSNSFTGMNEFTGQTNISGPDANTNVEIGSVTSDANAGSGGNNVVIGSAANSTAGANQVLIGTSSTAGTNFAVALGYFATVTGNPGIALGAISSAGANEIVIGSSVTTAATKNVYFGWGATTVATASGTPVVLNAPGGTGTDNLGADITLAPGKGTGSAAGGAAMINRNLTLATGTTTQAQAPAYISCPTKILSNTSATVATIATITTTSTTGGSVKVFYTVVANNGTLQDTDAGEIVMGWNNNAGTVAVAASAVYGQMDSDASGTLAATPTVTAATNVVSVKLTPTWVTIVPTTVTAFVTFLVNGVNSVACQ